MKADSLAVGDVLTKSWRSLWALTPCERLRIRCVIDALAAHHYGLTTADFRFVLRDCDHPHEVVNSRDFMRTLDPKGFWRVDKDQPPELRHTVLAQVACHDLQAMGLEAFLSQNNGEGWMLPETLRLSDYGLGHDDRARNPQPVASQFGDRFLPWQLNEDVAQSWEECRRHAENIRAIRSRFAPGAGDREPGAGGRGSGGEERGAGSGTPDPRASNPEPRSPSSAPCDLFGQPIPTDLFGNELPPQGRKRK